MAKSSFTPKTEREVPVPQEPVVDPSERGGRTKPQKRSEPALPIAPDEEEDESTPPKVSPRYKFQVHCRCDGNRHGPFEVIANSNSEAVQRTVDSNPAIKGMLVKCRWDVKQLDTDPVNLADLTEKQVEALNVERERQNLPKVKYSGNAA